MERLVLNAKQFEALQLWFDPSNDEGEPLDPPDGSGVTIQMAHGQLCVNDCWLHTDGEWATFLQPMGSPDPAGDMHEPYPVDRPHDAEDILPAP